MKPFDDKDGPTTMLAKQFHKFLTKIDFDYEMSSRGSS